MRGLCSRPWIYVIGDAATAAPRRIEEVLSSCADGGADCIQVREPEGSDRDVVALTRRILAGLGPSGPPVLVNDRLDLARAAGANGVHLKGTGLPTAVVRRLAGPGGIVARSTHEPEEAERAGAEGADFVVFGPVFDTPSKRAFGPPLGLGALERASDLAGVPVLALGGVGPHNAAACLEAGASGIAVVRAAIGSDDPSGAVREMRGVLDAFQRGPEPDPCERERDG